LIKTHEIAGKIMATLEAFEGSRPVIDTPQILIVRGMSRRKITPEEMAPVVSALLLDLGAGDMDVFSDEASDVIGIMDEHIRDSVEVPGETDVYGIYKLKESFEAMNCHLEYALGVVDNIGVFIVLWMDKSGVGPKFVEAVVANLEV
jgi:hypothetical protein